MEQATKYRAFVGTVLFHAIIILLLVILRLSGSVKPPDAEGITVNFGTDVAGMGAEEPAMQEAAQQEAVQPVTPARTEPAPVKARPVKEKVKEPAPKLLTQDNEEAPTLRKEREEKLKKDKEEKEIARQEELERQRVAAVENQRIEAEKKKLEQQQSQVNAIKGRMGKSFGGAAVNGGTQGEGNTQGSGNQGDPTGSVDSKNRGPGGGQGAGITFSLEGRGLVGGLAKPDYSVNDYGDVVVAITVNKDGDVISAVPGAKGTTTTNSTLWEAARKAAVKAKFNKLTAPDAPVYSKGTITYKFKLL